MEKVCSHFTGNGLGASIDETNWDKLTPTVLGVADSMGVNKGQGYRDRVEQKLSTSCECGLGSAWQKYRCFRRPLEKHGGQVEFVPLE